ncbi:MAG: YkvA family protein [Anaerolineae bacterium]
MLRAFINQLRLTWRLMRDPRVPLWTKAIPIITLGYILSPLDLIPDVLPIIGQIDDLGVLLAGLRLFEAFIPEDIVQQHRLELAGKPLETIEAPSYSVTHPEEDING